MNIGILLRKPFQQLVDEIHETLAIEGYPEIRPAQGIVFQFIGKNGSRLTELAIKAQITKQSMSYLVEYLEKEGHIEKTDDETDKRAKIFRLTKKGWDVVAIAEKAIENFETNCKKKLGAVKYKQLINLLNELDDVGSS
ncbi:MAG TPA: MarR family winged helix-turn-helix transcriptional regulator [Chitinophagales bacterium]|nr:MarR family winged helix-turn-helix transcriptional regulator [Chitinophagales bacterium]